MSGGNLRPLPLFRAVYLRRDLETGGSVVLDIIEVAPRGFDTAGRCAPKGEAAVHRYIRRHYEAANADVIQVSRAFGDPRQPAAWRLVPRLSVPAA
ncbi:hypothetical protein [Bosea sp. FBZP-16]|uniref:hypothetical protein n=1 Tax=Bosea sp. FBZP-16 TaxID=2065382 RepID=UPI000C3041B7|nr:hypothetical protein [Bosea sp. FBZP-16]